MMLPPRERREEALRQALDSLSDYWDGLPQRPVGPVANRAEIAAEIGAFDFEEPVDLTSVIAATARLLDRGMVHVGHPRYFGLFNPAPAFAGVLGDLLAAAYNPQLAARSHAPAAVDVENHLIRSFGSRLGFPPDELRGHFTSGGSEANMTAAVAALTRRWPDYAEEGIGSLVRRPLFYVSRESHHSWFKIAHQLGLGRSAVRIVPTDGIGRLDPARLEALLADDCRAGAEPFMIVATAGTTNAGMIDPIGPCADLARRHGLWLHVDAAWGGAAAVSERLRPLLAGVEAADSVTVDAHKWLSVPMGAGMFIARAGDVLHQAFRVTTSYMPSSDAAEDPYILSSQWSRRFIGLKLFMALAAAGWPGYAAMVERQVDLASDLRTKLEGAGFSVVNGSALGVLCFLPPAPCAPADVVARVQANNRCWVSAAEFEGRQVIRAALTSFRTGPEDLDILVEELVAASSPRAAPLRAARGSQRGARDG